MDDPDLPTVRALQAGDDSALDELMARHQEAIFRFICRHVASEADAVELAQEVFIRAYFHIASYKPEAKSANWLYHIALNLCRDFAKSRRAKQAAITDSISAPVPERVRAERELPSDTPTPAEEAVLNEKMRVLEKGMQQLPPDLRTALILAVFEQRSHQECADLLDTTAKTIETRVHRARKLLLSWMSDAGY